MFTGIIHHIGKVTKARYLEDELMLEIQCSLFKEGQIGASFAINGACLTQVRCIGSIATFNVVVETLQKTNLRFLEKGDDVHVEESLSLLGKVEGHFVQGHVDGLAKIIENIPTKLVIEVSKDLSQYLIPKGSIAIDGTSLTIAGLVDTRLEIALIPHTYENTLFRQKKEGDFVNIEIDMFAKTIFKYLDKLGLKGVEL